MIGLPGGTRSFTSVAELAVRYAVQLADGGFEATGGGKPAWILEGTAANGVDRGLGFAHSGANNGWIRTSGTGWINASAALPADAGRFGVRVGSQTLAEQTFAASNGYVHHEVTMTIPAGVHEVTVYGGFEPGEHPARRQFRDGAVGGR